jgi:putative two-component system response regulator
VSLADVYDALTSKRVYKEAYSHDTAMQMILEGQCGAFNPLLLECLLDISEILRTEMKVISVRHRSENEILMAVDAVLEEEEQEVSAQTFHLLERERMKYQFLIGTSDEIYFEYTQLPELLSVSNRGAKYLGIPEMIYKPSSDEGWLELFGKDQFDQFLTQLKRTTPNNPVVELTYPLQVKGETKACKIIAQTMWGEENASECEGAVGRIVELHRTPDLQADQVSLRAREGR